MEPRLVYRTANNGLILGYGSAIVRAAPSLQIDITGSDYADEDTDKQGWRGIVLLEHFKFPGILESIRGTISHAGRITAGIPTNQGLRPIECREAIILVSPEAEANIRANEHWYNGFLLSAKLPVAYFHASSLEESAASGLLDEEYEKGALDVCHLATRLTVNDFYTGTEYNPGAYSLNGEFARTCNVGVHPGDKLYYVASHYSAVDRDPTDGDEELETEQTFNHALQNSVSSINFCYSFD